MHHRSAAGDISAYIVPSISTKAFIFLHLSSDKVIFSLGASGLPGPVKFLEGHGKSRDIAAPGSRRDGRRRNWRRIYGDGNVYVA